MARAGSTSKYPWGDAIDAFRAKYNSIDGTVPVGTYRANAFGVHDTAGNVWEWVEDCWHGSYNGAPSDGSSWTSRGDCSNRVLRAVPGSTILGSCAPLTAAGTTPTLGATSSGFVYPGRFRVSGSLLL